MAGFIGMVIVIPIIILGAYYSQRKRDPDEHSSDEQIEENLAIDNTLEHP